MNQRSRVFYLHLFFSLIILVTIVLCSKEPSDGTPDFNGVQILIHVKSPVGIPPIDTSTVAKVSYKDKTFNYAARYQFTEMKNDGFYDIIITLQD